MIETTYPTIEEKKAELIKLLQDTTDEQTIDSIMCYASVRIRLNTDTAE